MEKPNTCYIGGTVAMVHPRSSEAKVTPRRPLCCRWFPNETKLSPIILLIQLRPRGISVLYNQNVAFLILLAFSNRSLDSLWFYTNIFTSTDAKECPKTDLEKPNASFLVESQKVENLTPGCDEFGGTSSAFEQVRGRETRKRDKKKRRKLGFDVKEVSGYLKFKEESYKHHIHMCQNKMPPFHDDVAMKQHLKSWAYAVACTL
ncbi:hypothetical protein CR513_59880, partial [Mucuna pruriens]